MGGRGLAKGHSQKGVIPLTGGWPRAILALLGALALLPGLGCVGKKERQPGALVVALDVEPRTLDPRYYTDAAASKLGGLIFEGLVRNQGLVILPALAQSWETPTPTRYVFHLRPGLAFHDGRPLTASDVKATFEYVMNPANKSPRMKAFSEVAAILAPDPLTVIFDLKKPSAPFLSELVMGVLPAGAGKEVGEAPVGSGPFRFVKAFPGGVELASFGRYREGAPKIERLTFRFIPDETVRTLELERGGVDMVMNPITPDLLPRFEKNPNLAVIKRAGTSFSYLGFNMEDKLTGDPAVRRALAHAIDRASVIRHALKGLAEPADGMFPPDSPYYVPDLPRYGYDPAKAKRILDAAGYKDPDGDGPQTRFTLKFSTSQNELRKRLAEIYQWQLAQVGIGLEIRSYEWGTFYGHILKGNFQVFSLTWVGIADPDVMHYVFHSSMTPPSGANRGRYNNPEVDRLTEAGESAFGADRAPIYAQAQRIVAQDLVYLPLWRPVNVAVAWRRLKGFAPAPDEGLDSLKTAAVER